MFLIIVWCEAISERNGTPDFIEQYMQTNVLCEYERCLHLFWANIAMTTMNEERTVMKT